LIKVNQRYNAMAGTYNTISFYEEEKMPTFGWLVSVPTIIYHITLARHFMLLATLLSSQIRH